MSVEVLTHGGSGGETATIIVTGLDESDAVSASKDGKVVHGEWNAAIACHTIEPIKEYGMWTVFATDGELTTTQNVLVDIATDYEIEISYPANYTMLYDAGDECVDVTGGWGTDGYTNGNLTIKEGRKEPSEGWIRVQGMKNNSYNSMLGTLSPIDFSAYTVVGILSENTGSTTRMGFITSLSKANYASSAVCTLEIVPSTKKIYTADIADAENTKYAQIYAGYNSAEPFLYLYHAWLAKQDDWQTLCDKAGLDSSAYKDETVLCANSSAISAILGNIDAVKFMTKYCTGSFMTTFIASNTCLSALESSSNKNLVYANEHWSKFLAMVGVTV